MPLLPSYDQGLENPLKRGLSTVGWGEPKRTPTLTDPKTRCVVPQSFMFRGIPNYCTGAKIGLEQATDERRRREYGS